MRGEEVAPRGVDGAHGSGVEGREIDAVGVFEAVFEALGRDQAVGGLEGEFGPVEACLDEGEWAKRFPWGGPLSAVGLGPGVDEVDCDYWL